MQFDRRCVYLKADMISQHCTLHCTMILFGIRDGNLFFSTKKVVCSLSIGAVLMFSLRIGEPASGGHRRAAQKWAYHVGMPISPPSRLIFQPHNRSKKHLCFPSGGSCTQMFAQGSGVILELSVHFLLKLNHTSLQSPDALSHTRSLSSKLRLVRRLAPNLAEDGFTSKGG